MSQTTKSAILLFAHGSSDAAWAAPFERIAQRLREKMPGARVVIAYLERMAPDFATAVDVLHKEGVTHITVAPLFLAVGGHMRADFPVLVEAARARYSVEFTVLPVLGEIETVQAAMVDAILDRR